LQVEGSQGLQPQEANEGECEGDEAGSVPSSYAELCDNAVLVKGAFVMAQRKSQ